MTIASRDFRELHRWVSERSFREWDEEIQADAAAGKFDGLRQRIRADYEAGKCTDL